MRPIPATRFIQKLSARSHKEIQLPLGKLACLRAVCALRISRFTTRAAFRFRRLPPVVSVKPVVIRLFSAARHGILRFFYTLVFLLYHFGKLLLKPTSRFLHSTGTRFLSAKHRFFDFLEYLRLSQRQNRLSICALILTVAAATLAVNYVNIGLEVSVNGELVGRVENQQQFEDLVHSVEARAATHLGRPYIMDADIGYRFSLLNLADDIDPTQTERMLFSAIDDITGSYVLRVDGNIVGANISKTALDLMLDRIMESYVPINETSTLEFVQDVRVSEEYVATNLLRPVRDIEAMLCEPVMPENNYVVQKGDTLSHVALQFGTTTERIAAINPEIESGSLREGQVLLTGRQSSMLSIKEVSEVTYSVAVPYDTVVEKNDTMYKTKRKVVTRGAEGEDQIVARISYVDGTEVGRDILSETRLSEPVTQIEHVGTLEPPPTEPTGTYKRPSTGYVSSNYGYRGREFHTGVDFATSSGSPIIASDGGKVTFSGWNGGYGKCIIIDHGDGVETLYAHCSSLLVTAGQKVAQGETIARVGSTGRSTGPHCHFEVRIGGKHVNPWKYIN